jgi:hypothetical protein
MLQNSFECDKVIAVIKTPVMNQINTGVRNFLFGLKWLVPENIFQA